MSDLNNKINISNTAIVKSQTSISDIILNLWKFKVVFFYIFISLAIFFFFLDNFISKKTLVEIRFRGQNSLKIDLNSEMLGIDTATHELLTLANLNFLHSTGRFDLILEEFFDTTKVNSKKIDWHKDYFYKNLISSKNLNRFSKINEDEYKLYEYISKNNISIIEKKKNIYALVLPEEFNTVKFFSDYIDYIKNLSLDSLKKDVIQFENNKIKLIERELSNYKKINFEENSIISDEDIIKKHLSIIEVIIETKISSIKNKISYLSDLKTYDIEEDILMGPISKKIISKYQRIIFVSPIFLSLIFYLLYILLKIEKQNKTN